MKYDRVYEVVDARHVEPDRRLGVVAAIRPVRGAIEVVSITGAGFRVDDSFGFDDDHQSGIVALSTHEGRVTLTELDLKRYQETVEPFIRGFVPEFSNESELHSKLLSIILED